MSFGIIFISDLPNRPLAELATDKCVAVREAVARHPKTSADILAKLAKDGEHLVRLWCGRKS